MRHTNGKEDRLVTCHTDPKRHDTLITAFLTDRNRYHTLNRITDMTSLTDHNQYHTLNRITDTTLITTSLTDRNRYHTLNITDMPD